ncbi:MAG: DNA primase [Verrucomicrobiota bacterium]|nr:DNA primase [Verrucomicrobiota bacterium]
MPVIKPSCISDLKNRVSLVDVVARVATPKKVGSRWRALCPFHNEKTPSFYIDPDKGFYKCFGCGKAGDVITFVRETEQLAFTEAIETLGQRFGVPIEYEEGAGPSQAERSLRQELFDLHELAAGFFRETFLGREATGEFMRAYWTNQRRFSLELADEFKVGAAAPDDAGLAARALKKKFSEEALRASGLFFIRDGAVPSAGALRPRFRGRLMIPIRDHQGRVVAFTARQTELTPADDPAREAKYVNSPETPIFTKGQLLFNLDRARAHVGDGKPFVLVEGQLDAMRCWSVGLKTAVAPQGTAITESQLALLRRYTPQVECFFDSDSAGQKAALRFLPMALKAGLEIKFLTLGGAEKMDPDVLFLERGLAAYDELQRGALSAMAFACRSLLPSPAAASPEQKARTANQILELILTTESNILRIDYVAECAAYLGRTPTSLHEDINKLLASKHGKSAITSVSTDVSPEYELLLLCLHFEALGKPLAQALPAEWIDTNLLSGKLLQRFLAEFSHDTWPGRDHLDTLLETPEEKASVASLLFDAPAIDDPAKVAAEGLRQLRARAFEPELRKIELALTSAAAEGEIDALSLIKRRTELQRQLRQPIELAEPV